MRIHSLSLEAFGPFPGREELDFETLNEAGLFLLSGPTGAGKSTLFEAVCFALYGGTTAGGQAQDLRSHFADPETEPWVELEFTVRGLRHRIRRTPVWQRPTRKQRSNATVLLQRMPAHEWTGTETDAGRWETLSTRGQEAGRTVQEIIGLTREQFVQVVMLPQGRFAQFLAAGSKEREALLRKLFPTELFDGATEALKERSAELSRRAEGRTERLEREHAVLGPALERFGLAPGPSAPAGDHAVAEAAGARRAEEARGTAAETSPDDAPGRPSSPLEDFAAALGALSGLRESAECRRSAASERRRAGDEEVAALAEAERLWTEHQELLERRTRLEAGAAERAERQERLESAERAAPVRAAHRLRAEAEAAEESSAQRVARCRQEWRRLVDAWAENGPETAAAGPAEETGASEGGPDGETPVPPAPSTGPVDHEEDPTNRLDGLRSRRDRLTAMLRRLADLERARSAAVSRREAADRAADRQQRTEERGRTLETRRTELEERTARFDERLEALPESRRAEERAREVLAATERRKRTEEERSRARQEAERAERRRREAVGALEALERARFDNAIGTVAADLRDGQPCPVCGSTEHPAPATPASGAEISEGGLRDTSGSGAPGGTVHGSGRGPTDLSADALGAARDRAEEARSETERLSQLLAALGTRVQELAEAGALEDADTARRALTAARERVEDLERTAEERAVAVGESERVLEEAKAHEEAAAAARAETERADALAESAAQEVDRLERGTTGWPSAEALEEGLRMLERLEAAARALDAALEARTEHQRMLALRVRETDDAVRASGFDGAERALAAALEAPDLERLRQAVARDRDETARADEAWNRPSHREFLHRTGEDGSEEDLLRRGRPSPGRLAEAREAAAAAAREAEEALAESTRLDETLRQVRGAETRYRGLHEESGRLAEEARRLKDLADVAGGGGSENLQRMSLTTFVLAAQLEEIAEAATVRLQEMTGGRYSLHHTDARASRNKKSGLELEVFDAWNSEYRPTGSLSGGESFMASLCLALGLADTVQARSGGIDVDTLFVDEGFGTLDEATLETVMDAIDGLRDNGRVVGLISHVADLKARIPQQVVVRQSPTGSTLETTTA